MATAREIPLTTQAQRFGISLSGVDYTLITWWSPASNSWVLSIHDADDNAILDSVPLITGANLLEQYDYLALGGQLIVQTDGDVNAVPTYENLGSQGHLYWVN